MRPSSTFIQVLIVGCALVPPVSGNAEPQCRKGDVWIAVDVSSSIGNTIEKLNQFALNPALETARRIQQLREDSWNDPKSRSARGEYDLRVGAMTFTDRLVSETNLDYQPENQSGNKGSVQKLIEEIPQALNQKFDQGTELTFPIEDAIRKHRTSPTDRHFILVIITDGLVFDDPALSIVTPYSPGGSIFEVIDRRKRWLKSSVSKAVSSGIQIFAVPTAHWQFKLGGESIGAMDILDPTADEDLDRIYDGIDRALQCQA